MTLRPSPACPPEVRVRVRARARAREHYGHGLGGCPPELGSRELGSGWVKGKDKGKGKG